MTGTVSLDDLLDRNPVDHLQKAVVAVLKGKLKGVSVVAHPGKVDLSELVGKAIVAAPGIGIGWSRIRTAPMTDMSFSAVVDFTAYIVAEDKALGNRRVPKEAVGIAIGNHLLKLLADIRTCTWGMRGVFPPEADKPGPELKPFFTIKDASQGTAYYVVTWTQKIADIGTSVFPSLTGRVDLESRSIDFGSAPGLNSLAPWIPAREVPDDA